MLDVALDHQALSNDARIVEAHYRCACCNQQRRGRACEAPPSLSRTPRPAGALKAWTLLLTASNAALIEPLDGEQAAVVPFLSYVHPIMQMAEAGPGHVDGRSNSAYLRSTAGQRLWAVHWSTNYADAWSIGAVYVPHPLLDWPSGSRLLGGH